MIDPFELKTRFETTNWEEHGQSGVNGGVFWLTKAELYAYYNEQWFR